MSESTSTSTFQKLRSHSLGIHWRKALVNLPRLVPDHAIRYTNPGGPHPVVFKIPSRGKHLIPVYVFIPPGIKCGETRDLPVLLDFHGGGFVLGSCLEQAPFCAKLCRDLNCIAISVDYRLGPYDKFPAALEDAEDILTAVLEETAPGYRELRDEINKAIRARAPEGQIQSASTSVENLSTTSSESSEQRLDLLRTATGASTLLNASKRPEALRTTTNASTTSTTKASKRPGMARSFTRRRARGDYISLDITRVAISGFSSGGNLALNLVTSVYPPQHPTSWPSVVPTKYPNPIAVLLYYPSFDTRKLPSERPRPEGLLPSTGFFAGLRLEDELMPKYISRKDAETPRASPGLADVSGIHVKARMQLILPALDSLNEQSEVWVKKVVKDGRGEHLEIERIPGVKHGWTQFPDGWLNEVDRAKKVDIFDKTTNFIRRTWEGEVEKSN